MVRGLAVVAAPSPAGPGCMPGRSPAVGQGRLLRRQVACLAVLVEWAHSTACTQLNVPPHVQVLRPLVPPAACVCTARGSTRIQNVTSETCVA